MGTLQELKARHSADGLTIEFASKEDKARFISPPQIAPFLEAAEQTDTRILFHTSNISQLEATVLEILAQKKVLPIKLEVVEPTVETLFLEAVK